MKDMLKIPEELEAMIADYKMNLIQVRSSESLKFCNYFLECSIVIMSIVREESAPAACQTISDMRIFYITTFVI